MDTHINNSPAVSIIIVNWNGIKWLEKCLTSLRAQSFQDFEIIFVDNASTDESVVYVRKHFPEVHIIESSVNLGFAWGNNLWCEHSKWKYIYLLNSDTDSSKNSLQELIDFIGKDPDIAIIQPQLLLMNDPEYYDAVATYWTYTTMLFYDGAYTHVWDLKYHRPCETYSIKGAACMIRKTVIDKIGLFDDTYWCYFEETDFCHRCWLSGYKVLYANTSPVYHAGWGASLKFENSFIQFHNFKNKLRTYFKNFSWLTLLYVIPMHFIVCTILIIYYSFKSHKKGVAIIKSLLWNIQNLSDTLEQRKKIQKNRKVSDYKYISRLMRNPPIKYYYYLLTDLKKYGKIR